MNRYIPLPKLFPIRLATIARLFISMAAPPAPMKIAIPKISYSALSQELQPNHIHKQPPLQKKSKYVLEFMANNILEEYH